MRKQHILIYGLSLSPILAHFQNTPRKLLGAVFVSDMSQN